VRFVEGDVRNFRESGPFDAVIARLLLFHLSNAVDVVRYQLGGLKPGGVVLAIDFDVGAARAEPAVPSGTSIPASRPHHRARICRPRLTPRRQ